MPAVVVHGAGDLRVEEVDDRPPGPGEVQVRIRYGGICGSDLHYAEHGAAGKSTVREPLVLGHELAGQISAVGPAVEGLEEGQRVVVHPAMPGGGYLGSAAHLPHGQGGFRERLVVDQEQIIPVPDELTLPLATLAEPLAVALHAVGRLGSVEGSTVLVVGAGTIGLLVISVLRSRRVGLVVVRDVARGPLDVARSVGADVVQLDGSDDEHPESVDAAIECSGTAGGLDTALRLTKRRGRVVEVGLSSAAASPVDLNRLVADEIELLGAFRFDREIYDAVQLLVGSPELNRIVAGHFSIQRAAEAFAIASQRPGKVLLET